MGVVSSLPIAQANAASAAAQPTPATAPPPALQTFAQAWNGLTAYTAHVSVFSEKGSDAENIVFNYDFRKPSSFTVHIIQGPNAGATLSGDGGPTVQATRGNGFFAALFKRTIPLHDPLVTTIRGASLDQLSFGAILAHAEQTRERLRRASESRSRAPLPKKCRSSRAIQPPTPD